MLDVHCVGKLPKFRLSGRTTQDHLRVARDATTGPCVIIRSTAHDKRATTINSNMCAYRYEWLAGLSFRTIETE